MDNSSKIDPEEDNNRRKLNEEEKEKWINMHMNGHNLILLALLLLIFWAFGLIKF